MRDIASMEFNKETEIDILGEAYEYLISLFSSNAGRNGGEYYTPPEISEILSEIACIGYESTEIESVYDPACGSGSLLLRFLKVTGNENITIFGQEINSTTRNLCEMNMLIHGKRPNKFSIALGDTLLNPKHIDWKFDIVLSNPPYSLKWIGDNDKKLIEDPRFKPAGVLAPKSRADFAFIMHCLYQLKEGGTAAIVEFPGVLYRTGAEKQIRKYLVDANLVDGVIQLPEALFFGTSIPTCILVLKNKREKDAPIKFIEASNLYVSERKRNRIDKEHIQRIVEAYKSNKEEEFFYSIVKRETIQNNDYNLAVNCYVDRDFKDDQFRCPCSIEEELEKIDEELKNLENELNIKLKNYKS